MTQDWTKDRTYCTLTQDWTTLTFLQVNYSLVTANLKVVNDYKMLNYFIEVITTSLDLYITSLQFTYPYYRYKLSDKYVDMMVFFTN